MMTLMPINSTLNHIMTKELAISATLFAVLAAFMLYRIDVNAFQKRAHEPSFAEKVARATE